MVNYTSCATTNESTGVLTVLELLIAGIDVELLVSGSEPLRSALALSLDGKKCLMSTISCPLVYCTC